MTRLASWLLSLTLLGTVFAQVDIDLTMDREAFLPSEDVEVGVRIANFTGVPLTLGQDPRWLQFTVEELRGRVCGKLSDPPESGEFTLDQATRGKLRYNLTPLFSIGTPGVYRVFATLRLPGGEELSSPPKTFEIVNGVRLNEPREVGFLKPDGTFERRKFVLQRVSFLRKVQLYARVTDESETHTIRVIPLGATVSFDRPEWIVDRETQFHVLHRADSSHYFYHVLTADGTIQIRQLMIGDGVARPEIRVNKEGEVRVFGAIRRPYPGELPKPAEGVASSASGATNTNSPALLERSNSKTNEVPSAKQP